jgi:hypothetical protein
MTSTTAEHAEPTRLAKVKYWLVDDETIDMTHRGKQEAYRLRIWRAKDQPAVVLVSQLEGHAPPFFMTEKVANCVFRVWLKFLAQGMWYYEHAHDPAGLCLVDFVGIGHRDRLVLTDAAYETVPDSHLARLVGPVEGV